MTIEWQTRLLRSEKLARLMDSAIKLPGGYRIGLDGIIGLIPGVGDAIGGGFSSYIIYQAWQQGVPRSVILRMMVNVLLDSMLGAIPVLGDVFDLIWKSNLKNVQLLNEYRAAPGETQKKSVKDNLLFFSVLGGLLILAIYLFISLMSLVWHSIHG